MATAKLPSAVREETHGRRLQDELLFDLINRAPDAMAIIEESSTSTSYDLVYVNEAFYDLYRASKDEVIGNGILKFMSSRSTTEDLEHNFSLLKKGGSEFSPDCDAGAADSMDLRRARHNVEEDSSRSGDAAEHRGRRRQRSDGDQHRG